METKLVKVMISREAEEVILCILKKTNEGFDAGKISKTDLLSWTVLQFRKDLESRIEDIRRHHFDHVRYMESLLRDLKRRKKNGEPLPKLDIALTPLTQ